MASPLAAAGAYANAAKLFSEAQRALVPPAGTEQKTETSFASVLKDAIGAVNESGKKSDAQARAMVNGKGNMVDVVTAVAETEVAIDAVVAVRDKVIAAYEEIMKMTI
jgi:flagellar hook-basal body complex protein FliE